jgi:PAS domain S-box-containing protein
MRPTHEAALPVPSEDYRVLFESSPDGILLVDDDGIIRRANPRSESLFGYTRDELEGSHVEVLVPDASRGIHRQHRGRYTSDPHARPMGIGLELRARRRDGTEFPVEISLSPVDTGGTRLTLASIRDVTQRKRLRDFGAGALRASEDERARIARELHDDTAQRLATVLIRLRILERVVESPDAVSQIEHLRAALQEAADGVRRIARGLRPPELEDAGLAPALRTYARTLMEGRGVRVELDIDPVDRFLTPDGKLVVYRIVQEALNNVARHSGAAEARVRVSEAAGHILATVEDAGRGFSPARVQDQGGGLGLLGMQERAVMVGGSVTVDSRPGEGTRVVVRVPVEIEAEVERV